MTNRLLVELGAGGRVSVGAWLDGELLPFGEPVELALPLADGALEELRWYLEDYLQAPFGVYGDRGPMVEACLADWGTAMFSAVFGAGPGRDVYARVRTRGDDVEVVFRSSSPKLLGLPWELLRDPARPDPLALELAGVSRSLPVADAAETIRVPDGRLRVLMVISRPAGTADVGYRMIARPLLERLGAVRGQVDLVVLRPPTLEALTRVLSSAVEEGKPFQVVHFDGHGTLDGRRAAGGAAPPAFRKPSGEGLLVFEGSGGGADAVTASRVAQVLVAGQVPVVVLNACQSGAIGEDLAAAVATRLLQAGTASVVAMAYSVYAVAAAEFMTAFYERLFAGGTVSAAVSAGRRRLHRQNGRPSPKGEMPLADWLVPVHYLRRDIRFPQTVTQRSADVPPLDDTLDRLRRPEAGDGHGAAELAPVGAFVGRDGLFYELEVAARLQRVVVVHGPAGSGKTELAKAFGRWWRDTGGVQRPEWVIWHSFAPGVASFGLDAVLTRIGLHVYGSDFARLETAERHAMVTDLLREQRLLLIWDNFETVHSMTQAGIAARPLDDAGCAQMREFLAALARGGRSVTLITSRTREDWLGDVHRIQVGGLAAHEASEYAGQLLAPYPAAAPRREKRQFGELMEWLAGHPLSMRLTLPLLDGAEPETLLDGLRGAAPLPAIGTEDGIDTSLMASIDYSYAHLAAATRQLLPALSLFHGVADAAVLAEFSAIEEVPERFRGATVDDWLRALDDAARVGLLTELVADLYQIHPALPAYLAARWRADQPAAHEADREAAIRALLTTYSLLCASFAQTGFDDDVLDELIDRQCRTIGSLLSYAFDHRMWNHAQAIAQPFYTYLVAHSLGKEADAWDDRAFPAIEDSAGGPPGPEDPAYGLWIFLASSRAKRRLTKGHLDDAERGYQRIREILENQSPSPHQQRNVAVVSYSLGLIAQTRRRLEQAQEWYRRSLVIHQELGDRSGIAISYHHLSAVAEDRGQLDEARELCLESLTIAEEIGDRAIMAYNYKELGKIARIRGLLDEAEQWYLKALAISEDLGSRSSTAVFYNELGEVALLRGWLHEAEQWYLRSLAITEVLGDRPAMTASYHNLGMIAQDRGLLDEAQQWYLKSLTISEELGDRHGMAATIRNLGLLAEIRGDHGDALQYMVRCVALFDAFSDPAAGFAPDLLARLTARLGIGALETCWQQVTGHRLPQAVRDHVAAYRPPTTR